jgi:hypothetical protein
LTCSNSRKSEPIGWPNGFLITRRLPKAAGRRIKLTWDAENRLTEVGPADDVTPASGHVKVAFVYDYKSRRIGKTVYVHNGTTWTLDSERCYVWDGWLLLLETDGSDQVLRKYTWGLDLAGLGGAVNSRTAAGAGARAYSEHVNDPADNRTRAAPDQNTRRNVEKRRRA